VRRFALQVEKVLHPPCIIIRIVLAAAGICKLGATWRPGSQRSPDTANLAVRQAQFSAAGKSAADRELGHPLRGHYGRAAWPCVAVHSVIRHRWIGRIGPRASMVR